MNKYISIIFSIYITVTALSSCKKSFLDEENFSSYSPETLTDSLGFEASIVGLQNQVSRFVTYSDNQGWLAVWQAGTDIAYTIPTRAGGMENPYNDYNILTSTDGAASYAWTWAYTTINNANNIVKKIESPETIGMSQANKNTINAEARFFRAYAYNILATLFGRVPIITEPITAPKTDFVRAPLDDVNNLIVSDLTFAANNLKSIDSVKIVNSKPLFARANKAMAQQLLAEVYLRTNKPDLAEQQCLAIINSGKFNLITARYGLKSNQPGDPFSDMFIYGNQRRSQGNMEAIWVIEAENPSTVIGGITNSPQQRRVWGAAYHEVAGMKITDSLGGRSNARLRASNWVIYRLFQPGDMRNSKYNFRRQYYYNNPTSPNYGKPVPYAGNDTLHRIAPHPTKWYQFDPNDEFGFAMIKDFIMMRLGETYLLLAEAQFKQSKLNDAANSINALRMRSFPNYPAQGQVSASDITLDFILDERVRELIQEENRRMTLMRTGKLVERTLSLNGDKVTGLSEKHELLPVPQSEIDLNKDAKLDQNLDY